ncbi:DNA polymerase III subunit alpha [Bacillus cereus group sp. BcHK140]|uniref:DNA polymerase III subunit alpha n=1 Tax=Bacillus cereus group sp. BcHK140 TaxID=3018092 RepID=UPI0022E2B636|nr:DNA polymerase III subunit alpha [Bacillus cereus group sp. BcHK140]MDA1918137.1 DNA polymerase III subunit alpha [Bacillus cereus group sp. BcHK140]
MTMTLTNNRIVPFAHLHLHTPEGSLLDGFCRIDPMIKLAQEFGMDSIGVSDHGTCFAHIQFYKKCKAAGIHPVLGMEGYIAPRKQWKKADFDRINYTDVAYRTKEELAKLESEEYIAFEKKQRDSFTKGKTTKPEHIEFLAKLYEKDPVAFDALKKSTRWYLSGKQDDKQKRLFEWSPRIAHLLMIAKNNEGYKNLIKLTTIGSVEGFYGKPRFDYGDIKKYGKGIIATSSCLGGTIPQLIRRGKFRVAKNHIKFYKKCFDEFYLEIQPSTMQEQILVNNVLIEWSKELDVPLVATSDAHMLRPEDRPVHKAITSINKGKDEDESDIDVYEHCVFYSAEEMLAMGMPEEALINAYNIAHSCHVDLDESSIKYPEFEVPEDFDFDSYLAHISNKGLMEKIAEGNFVGKNFYKMYRKYKRRLDYELEVIKNKNISAYMLIVWDYINYAKRNGILVGPGRGSAAGSLVAYVTGITNLDPIRYNLLFERFINPERPGFPDIDTDFDYLRRHEVIEYVTKKYGADKVAQIATFGTLSTKSALKDIGRALGIDHNEINEVNKYIPSHQGKVMPISEALEEIKEVKAYAKKYPRLFELALEVESMPRTQGIHACGMLITAEPITNEVALVRGKGGESVAGYDGPTLEAKGYIKFDFLGLKNLSVVELCRRMVEDRYGYLIDVDNLIPEDQKTFDMIQRGETDGIFQIESDGMKKMFMGLNKVDFETLIAGVSLYRPGPMDYIPKYTALANGHEEVPEVHPAFDEITRNTFSIMIYQEQVMQVSTEMAGYSKGEADVLRKAVGKKKIEILEPALEELHNRLTLNNVPAQVATKICDDIRPFAGYAFNRSHAACYAYIAYQTAYLKANYPLEYMTALLQVFYTEEDKVVKLVKVIRDMGIEVLPPDINRSEIGFTIDGENAIRFGLGAIKGLGEATLEAILEERKPRMAPAVRDADGLETIISQEEADEIEATPDLNIVVGSVAVGGPFTSAKDVINRIPKKNFNKKAIASLCYSGAFDTLAEGLCNNRFEYLAHMYDIRGEAPDAELIEQITKYTDRIKFEKEREVLGLYISGHVLDRLAEPTDWEGLDDATHTTMVALTEARVIRTKKGDNMAFLRVDTLEGERSLTLFPSHYEQVKEGLVAGMIMKVGIKGQMNWQRNQKDFIINSITIPKKINKDIWKQIEKDNVQLGVA